MQRISAWIRDHPVRVGGVIVVVAGGVVAAALFGRGLLFWMLWAGIAVALVVGLSADSEEPPPGDGT
jgi:uncharacterized membrane protein